MSVRRSAALWIALVPTAVAGGLTPDARAGEEASVSGTFTANGTAVKLPFVYVWALDKSFYNDSDPA